MKFLVAISLAAFATAAYAAPPPADQAQVSEFACELGGDCAQDSAATPATVQPDAAAPAGARSSSVRGFTFKKQAPVNSAAPLTDTASAASSSSSMSSTSGSSMASTAPVMRMPAKGVANLRLDFASGSAELDQGDRQRLGALATALSGSRLSGRRLRIEGHTDSKGSEPKNVDLSRRRAQSVADYLISSGVSRNRLDVVGFGSSQPLPGRSATDGANRRVMAVMLN